MKNALAVALLLPFISLRASAQLVTMQTPTVLPKDTKADAILAYCNEQEKFRDKPSAVAPYMPQPGEPLLLVYDLEANTPAVETATDGPDEGKGALHYNRLTISRQGVDARFRVLLLPFRAGEAVPVVRYQNKQVTVQWADQTDTLLFNEGADNRTHITVERSNSTIGTSR